MSLGILTHLKCFKANKIWSNIEDKAVTLIGMDYTVLI